jgi:hypothetical protein
LTYKMSQNNITTFVKIVAEMSSSFVIGDIQSVQN